MVISKYKGLFGFSIIAMSLVIGNNLYRTAAEVCLIVNYLPSLKPKLLEYFYELSKKIANAEEK